MASDVDPGGQVATLGVGVALLVDADAGGDGPADADVDEHDGIALELGHNARA